MDVVLVWEMKLDVDVEGPWRLQHGRIPSVTLTLTGREGKSSGTYPDG